ncbi:hypothetical protein B0H15DRAFT_800842 [Mycena belliarum]|uniref:Protein kinase domain-containing protein n=1 Tax=Mycena belliarum TaxID=1033014 RepID=A0AAD6XP93_9AGAR|nr:hypothetical protein B0H15DRAFT_800842 [Mycena belliae]
MDAEPERQLAQFLTWNPPGISSAADSEEICLPMAVPFRASYDQHIDQNLTLRYVRTRPSLVDNVANQASKEISNFEDRGGALPAAYLRYPDEDVPPHREMDDASAVTNFYAATTAMCCIRLAATILFGNRPPVWLHVLRWHNYGGPRVPQGRYVSLDESSGPVVADGPNQPFLIDDHYWVHLDDITRDTLRSLFEQFPVLAIWEVFRVSKATDKLIKDLGCTTPFVHRHCGTRGFVSAEFEPRRTVDATVTPWHEVAPSDPSINTFSDPTGLRRSSRLVGSKTYQAQPQKKSMKQSKKHAWSRAVARDATFIVFHNGKFERIGVRDRASQTLYLSELIEVQKCESPCYGKIHTGLHMSIIRDALDRVAQLGKTPTASLPSGAEGASKRRLDSDNTHRRKKRQKTEGSSETESEDIQRSVVRALSARNLALVHLQYHFYNSIAPASFLRIGASLSGMRRDAPTSSNSPELKESYDAREYIALKLVSELGNGACGVVHGAVAKIQSENGDILSMDVVVKVAILPFQRKKLSHEYSIYQHLAPFNIKGIPEVYGLFEDVEDTGLAMVMSRCSSNLWDLRPDPDSVSVFVSPAQRAQFLATLRDIHHAGVRHRDLRPENLMLTDAGDPVIIDFDSAKLDPGGPRSLANKEAEMEHRIAVLNGDYPDREQSEVSASTRSRAQSEDFSEYSA